ncbi:MAG: hypothetical protein ACXIUM_14635 [Wenzhouxiangella sp.]
MSQLFESGRIIDVILVVMLIEAAVIVGLGLRFRDRLPVRGLCVNLAAGAGLLLALRALLTGAGWLVAGFWLGCALIAHLSDLMLRLRH